MERPPIFMKQYYENSYTIKSNLQIQCNAHQNSNVILCKNRKHNSKIHMEAQKTLKNQSNPEQKKQCWNYHNTWLTLYRYSNKNSMALAQKKNTKTNGIE
jgi:hypothetical protein